MDTVISNLGWCKMPNAHSSLWESLKEDGHDQVDCAA